MMMRWPMRRDFYATKIARRKLPGKVTHVFTHFPLELTVLRASVPRGTPAPDGARWVKLADLGGEALPSVMRKVLAHALKKKNKKGGEEKKGTQKKEENEREPFKE